MAAELAREAGVLLMVFGVLEVYLTETSDGHVGKHIWTRLVLSVILLIGGFALEKWRPE
jgi:hypothetical protein